MDRTNGATRYNLVESQMAGLPRESMLDQNFFLGVGVCMNNFLVAQRFEDDPALDVIMDYVLTFRMRPTPVKLRLLQHPHGQFRYILIQRRRAPRCWTWPVCRRSTRRCSASSACARWACCAPP